MIHIKRYNELIKEQSLGIPNYVKPEKIPHCSTMSTKGYKIEHFSDNSYAFNKNYDLDDDVYWLGKNTTDYQYGKKYQVTPEILAKKEHLPFYSMYCKCDPSPTDEQKKMQLKKKKEMQQKIEKKRKEKEKETNSKKKD